MSKSKNLLNILQCVKLHEVKVHRKYLRCTVYPAVAQRGGGFTQAGASVRLGREQTMLLPALCQTRLHPRLRETARCATAMTRQRKIEKTKSQITLFF